ncbi:MAG: hypothetical protein K0R39_4692 [Symbiobacteriaceae bacterium]|jgi:molecular chaperone GrpE (heat shock protein)|nr:hypothetical protein [Symbiobacteriaceae bacterium]
MKTRRIVRLASHVSDVLKRLETLERQLKGMTEGAAHLQQELAGLDTAVLLVAQAKDALTSDVEETEPVTAVETAAPYAAPGEAPPAEPAQRAPAGPLADIWEALVAEVNRQAESLLAGDGTALPDPGAAGPALAHFKRTMLEPLLSALARVRPAMNRLDAEGGPLFRAAVKRQQIAFADVNALARRIGAAAEGGSAAALWDGHQPLHDFDPATLVALSADGGGRPTPQITLAPLCKEIEDAVNRRLATLVAARRSGNQDAKAQGQLPQFEADLAKIVEEVVDLRHSVDTALRDAGETGLSPAVEDAAAKVNNILKFVLRTELGVEEIQVTPGTTKYNPDLHRLEEWDDHHPTIASRYITKVLTPGYRYGDTTRLPGVVVRR